MFLWPLSLFLSAVELYNQNAERLDNMTIHFETLDTCFCYGYCGCAVSTLHHSLIVSCIAVHTVDC